MQRHPEEIVANILTRLPVKKLLQIKCVCKLWNSTISDPQFAKLHLQQSNKTKKNGNNSKLLVLPIDTQPISLDYENGGNDQFGETKLDFPLVCSDQFVESLGCCDGMCYLKYGSKVVVWNPSIRQYRTLPQPVLYRPYGFGFDAAADDYKVYRAIRKADKLVLEVFALKTNCWRRVEILTSLSIWHQSRNSLHGSASEKFLEVPLPDVRGVVFTEMVVFDGCLCVYCDNNDNSGIEIWIMKEYMLLGLEWGLL